VEGCKDSKERRLVQVYTGGGKGKTTAAWGQAIRAVGCGWKVAVVRFLKTRTSGECKACERLAPELALYGDTSSYDPCVDQRESPVLRQESRRNFELAKGLILSGEWDMIVLDEINVVLYYGFVSREEMLETLRLRPAGTEIVLTGRYAPDWLIEAADLVTEMVEVKHPSNNGLKARRGTEY